MKYGEHQPLKHNQEVEFGIMVDLIMEAVMDMYRLLPLAEIPDTDIHPHNMQEKIVNRIISMQVRILQILPLRECLRDHIA
jgi:hypothetical protein